MNRKTKFVLLWVFPILIALAFEFFMADFRSERWQNVLENILFATAMLLTIPLFNSMKIKVFMANSYYFVFLFCLFFESAFFYLFDTIFSASAIFILIQTNAVEAQEFLGFYLDMPIFFFFLALLAMLVLFLRFPKKGILQKRPKRTKLYSIVSFVGILVFLKVTYLIVPNFPYLFGKALFGYVVEQQRMADIHIDRPIGDFENVAHRSGAEKSLYVLVIGESTTRNHLGLYGYGRNTTPRLNAIRDELLLYQNVISSYTYTIESLKNALTLNHFEGEKESSIVQLMNQAGFKTFWLSNQKPIGPYDSMVTEIARASDVVEFTNTTQTSLRTPYDGVLLSLFEKALNDPADKKFIVVHLLGTHMDYKYRYPETFDVYNGKPEGKFQDELAVSTINHYDNAIRYQDSVLRKLIEKTREQQVPGYVLYFSDHGDEVYDSIYFAGHTYGRATENMFEVPFILWRSEKFKKNNKIGLGNLGAPYVTDDFIHSLADLSQVHFKGMKPEKSIFSKKLEPKKRIVGKGIDFDEYFDAEE